MLIAGGIKAGIGGIKAISGAIQKNRANKELEKDFPKYTRPAEYEKLLGIYQKQAGMGQLPGQDRYESALSTRTARGVRATSKMADTGVAGVQAAMSLYGSEQQAVRDLGLSFADYQQKAQQNLAGAYQQGAQYSDKEWWQNVAYPDQVKRNMAAQKFNAGQQNLWGGIDMMGGAAMDFAGGYMNAQQGGGGVSQAQKNAAGIQTTPGQTASMQGFADDAFVPSIFRR